MMVSVNNGMLDSNQNGRESHATSHRRLRLRANEKGGEEDSGGGVRPIAPTLQPATQMGPDDGPVPSPLGLASSDVTTAFASTEAIRTSASSLRLMHARLLGLDLSSARRAHKGSGTGSRANLVVIMLPPPWDRYSTWIRLPSSSEFALGAKHSFALELAHRQGALSATAPCSE